MRAIAELQHPNCKITIFSMNQKFIVKLERGAYEQTYKVSEMDITDGVNGVFQLLDEEFIAKAISRFDAMDQDFKESYSRHEI